MSTFSRLDAVLYIRGIDPARLDAALALTFGRGNMTPPTGEWVIPCMHVTKKAVDTALDIDLW